MNQLKAILSKSYLLLLIGFVFIQCQQQKEVTKDQPNILWIVLEDMSPQFIGAYGNRAANTPVIDSLINAGTKFNAAFSTNAVCSPSRYSIITGTRTFEYGTGHHRSEFPIPESVQPFPKFLREAGYHTSNNAKRDYNTLSRWEITKASWVESSNTAGWWNRSDQPFFSVFNFNNCHQSRTFTNPYDNYKSRILDQLAPEEIIKDEEIILPDYYKDTPELRRELARTYNALKKTDKEIDTLVDRLRRDGLVESTIIFIYSDHGGGALRTKTQGIALGHQIPMAVIFPEKFQHLNPFAKQSETDQPVTFEDLGPTVLALAGLNAPESMTGKPFLGSGAESHAYIFCATDRSGENNALTRSTSDGRYFYSRDFIPGRPQYTWQKYFDYSQTRQLIRQYNRSNELDRNARIPFQSQPQELLYDIKTDTWQTNNLTQDADFREILEELRKELDAKLLDVKDVHFIPEYALDSISKSTTPYEFKESETYNFAPIYKIAKLAGSGTASIPEQVKALKNPDPFVRHWAAVGLAVLKKGDLLAFREVLQGAQNDPFPTVQITIASLMFREFDSEAGRETLRRYLYHTNKYLAIQASQEIVYFPKQKALTFLNDVTAISQNKIDGSLSESFDIYFHIFQGRELVYKTHW